MKTDTDVEARRAGLFASLSTKTLFCLCCAYLLITALAVCVALKPEKKGGFNDFGSFWESGRAASHGLNPYAQYPLTWVLRPTGADLNLNPPTLLPLFELLGSVNAALSMRLFTCLSAVVFLVALGALLRQRQWAVPRSQLVWLFLAPAMLDSLRLGQIYLMLFALSAAAWLCLERNRPLAAGILIGLLVAAKPNFGLWPLVVPLLGFCGTPLQTALAGSIYFGGTCLLFVGICLDTLAPKYHQAAIEADSWAEPFRQRVG